MKPIPIGQILVEQGTLTQEQVEQILKVQAETHRPFGDLAERLFGVDARAVEDAWVEQYVRTVGVLDLDGLEIDEQCLRLLNRRQAWQLQILPLGRSDGALNLATTTSRLVRSINFASRTFDEPVFMYIARRRQLLEFLMRHYPVPEHIAQFAQTMP